MAKTHIESFTGSDLQGHACLYVHRVDDAGNHVNHLSQKTLKKWADKAEAQTLDSQELAHVLAALRYLQSGRGGFDHPEYYEQLADVKALTDDEIDALCERINR